MAANTVITYGYPKSFEYSPPHAQDGERITWLDMSQYKWQLRTGLNEDRHKGCLILLGDVQPKYVPTLTDLGFDQDGYGFWSVPLPEDTPKFFESVKEVLPLALTIHLVKEPEFTFDPEEVYHDWVTVAHAKNFNNFTTWPQWQQKFFMQHVIPGLPLAKRDQLQTAYLTNLAFYSKSYPEIRKLQKSLRIDALIEREPPPAVPQEQHVTLWDCLRNGEFKSAFDIGVAYAITSVKNAPKAAVAVLRKSALFVCETAIAVTLLAGLSTLGCSPQVVKYLSDSNLRQDAAAWVVQATKNPPPKPVPTKPVPTAEKINTKYLDAGQPLAAIEVAVPDKSHP